MIQGNTLMRGMTVITCLLCLAAYCGPLQAEETSVPEDLQLRLFSKILAFDRNLTKRAGPDIVVGVIFQSKYRQSLESQQALTSGFEKLAPLEIQELPVKLVSLDLDRVRLEELLAQDGVDVLYVTPLRAIPIQEIETVSSSHHVLTFTGVPEYVRMGLTVGVALLGGRPQILVNIDSMRRENVDFHSRLLNLAQVIRPETPKR